jgi:ADP-heptose:LPS heptosyltransferase
MRVSTQREIDRWVGTSLTVILSFVRKVFGRVRRSASGPVRSILFVKLAEQGSTVLAYGAILRAIEMVGHEHVYFLVFEENRFIIDALKVIPKQNVIVVKMQSVSALIVSALTAVLTMRRLRLDAAVDMEFFARASAIFMFLSGASRRVGFHSYAGDGPYRGDLMTHRMVYNPHLHTAQVFEVMVEALNHPPETFPALGIQAPAIDRTPAPMFTPSPGETGQVEAMIRKATGKNNVPPMILLNANCSDLLPLRRWESGNYVLLAQRLLERYGDLYIAFTGAPSERDPVERLVRQVASKRCISFAGQTTMRQLLILYMRSQVLVTNDSGPAHFATLTPIHVITLFGPETPRLFGSPSVRSHVIWAGTVCSPCVNAYNNRMSKCRNNLCMQRISVDEVFEKTCEIYEQQRLSREKQMSSDDRILRKLPLKTTQVPSLQSISCKHDRK